MAKVGASSDGGCVMWYCYHCDVSPNRGHAVSLAVLQYVVTCHSVAQCRNVSLAVAVSYPLLQCVTV